MSVVPKAIQSQTQKLKIESLPGKGRCFIATESIPLGETVFVAEPFAAIVDQNSKEAVCSHCVKEPSPDALMKITCLQGCDKLYCSQECREKSWADYHHLECSFIIDSSLQNYAKDYAELLIRVLIKMHHKKDHLDIPNIEGMWFDLNQQTAAQLQEYKLVSKVLDRFVDEKLLDFKFPVVDPEFISSLEGKLNIFPITPQRAYLYSLISKEECNSFGLYTFLYKGSKEHRQGFGLALYPSPVYFNHGCDPNVGRIYTAEGKMHFFAIKPIEKSQEACITYIDLDWDLDKRQKVLKEYFCFECVCSRCTEERKFKEDNLRVKLNSLALCGANGCKASLKPLRKNQWECIGCSITVEL